MLASVGQEQASTDWSKQHIADIGTDRSLCCVTRYPNVIFAAIHRTLDQAADHTK